jgi:hypothetical protein
MGMCYPGQTGIPRELAKSCLTPRVESWPADYESGNIISKEIP